MNSLNLRSIAEELNSRAPTHRIGSLQELRGELKHLSRVSKPRLFKLDKVRETWAFHFGGRSELQFNIGIETAYGTPQFRHGVAFSFETSRFVHSIDLLIPKASRFNEFLRVYSASFADMRMWHFDHDVRSSDSMPGPIPPELVREDVFIFLGKLQATDDLDYDLVLADFDRLLPMYEYVEGIELFPLECPTTSSTSPTAGFRFRSGCSVKSSSTVATVAQRQLDVLLRHNELQAQLVGELSLQFGSENVGAELASLAGTSVDVVLRQPGGFWFYEIKTGLSARACLREAIGQLLEYSFWPGAQGALRLIVVGEPQLGADAEAYLVTLRGQFGLPLEYKQITLAAEASV